MAYALEVESVSKEVDGFLLDNISFSIDEGSIMGLVGTNGSGKTTLINLIVGLTKCSQGNIRIYGIDNHREEKKAKDIIGFVLDDNPFIEYLSAKDNSKLYAPYYSNWDETLFYKYCKMFEVNVKKPLRKLSQGTKTKFQLAFALSHGAKLLVMDEPAAGLDPVFRRELVDILFDVIIDGERSVLMSTHLTNELDRIADTITLIHKGQQIFTMEKEEMYDGYQLVRGTQSQVEALPKHNVIGSRNLGTYSEALIRKSDSPSGIDVKIMRPTIEDIMFYYGR